MPLDDVITAYRRTELALCEQLASWESLEFGVAFCAARFPDSPDANHLRDVWLADAGAAAFERAEAFYAARALRCLRWTPASGQPVDAVDSLLASKGWMRREWTVLTAADFASADAEPDPGLRILPARAMRRAFRDTFAGDAGAEAVATERMNDSRYEAVVALLDGEPAGRGAYVEAGEIARLTDVFVMPSLRRRGVGRTVIGHFLRTARRLLPRVLVAGVDATNAGGRTFFQSCGFVAGGTVLAFDRPVV